MSDINARNVGSVVNNPNAPVNITNIFKDGDKPSLPSNIPSPKGFVGRAVELAALHQAKSNGKTSFVLHGQGGVGKSDLSLRFIHEIRADYSAHIRVDMFGLSDRPTSPKDSKLAVIRAFKPEIPTTLVDTDINDLYISLLSEHKTILFFDNVKDREQIIPLCKDIPAFVVVTSRTNLYVAGCFSLPVEQMSSPDARNLLYSIADEARFDGQADVLAYLAGYLPMALLPLGGILAEYSTIEAAELVAKFFDRKERLQLADPNRENLSVETSFNLSYERLSDELKACWRKLAIFPGDFDLQAMQAVWQTIDGKQIRNELVNKHLLEFNPITKRSYLHDLARDFGSELLTESELFETQRLFSQHYGNILGPLVEVTLENLNAFELERVNILNGFYWAKNALEVSLAEEMPFDQVRAFAALCVIYAASVGNTIKLKLKADDYISLMETGLSASEFFDEVGLSPSIFLGNLGIIYRDLNDFGKSIEFLDKALIVARKKQDRRTEAINLLSLGNTYMVMGETDKAREYLEQALSVSTEIGYIRLVDKCEASLSSLNSYLGDDIKAIETITEILEKGDIEVDTRASLLLNLGLCYLRIGQRDKGWELAQESRTLFKSMGKTDEEVIAMIAPFDENSKI